MCSSPTSPSPPSTRSPPPRSRGCRGTPSAAPPGPRAAPRHPPPARPPVLLLDEPTTGLDASVAAGVLDLLRGLLEETGVAAVVVSHGFCVIDMLTRRVLVMRHGRVVESGLTDQLLEDPQHPYSQQLVAAARG